MPVFSLRLTAVPLRLTAVPLLAVALLAAGCTQAPRSAPAPLTPTWRAVTLPPPPGPPGRIAVRDAAYCAGEWYVVGGVFTDGESRPAAWRSRDGRAWNPVRFAPRWFWAHRNVIYSVACRDGTVAMVGAKSGGAHGNPRVSTWYARDDGVFTDVLASFELYGGTEAVNVGPLTASDAGWLLVGNRSSGAAVWTSEDATEFHLLDTDPALSSDDEVRTIAQAATYADGFWIVVGSANRSGQVTPTPMAWRSADGTSWHRERVPLGSPADIRHAELHRVIDHPDGVLAVGIRSGGFGVWRRTSTGWEDAGSFGAIDPNGTASPFVSGLTWLGPETEYQVVATVSDSAGYQLWAADADGDWRRVKTPSAPTTGGERVMTAVSNRDHLMLLTDDATTGRVWLTDVSDLG